VKWIAFVVVATLLTACGPSTFTYQYHSPSGFHPFLEVQPEGDREAASGRRNEVFLCGAPPPAIAGHERPSSERIRLGSFIGVWNPAAIAWLDDSTINVCPLNREKGVPESVSILVTETTRRTIRITTDCPEVLRAAPAASPPG
jgi:hypothetical protein